ncbi:hypothetical protein [Bradyrhizobium sp. AZCC 2289]|jgi:hypothetical protein|uniref:hypothetical protein n=1 Tax=Bradyrhizobium sp. AZCC 2289 TaxID=3117026 RepID=UPI002FF1D54E
MQKSLLAIAAAFSFLIATSGGAISGPYPFGDAPYTLNWGSYPQIESGCWKWNWQQDQWNDYCAVYVHPKAYMYPRSARAVLRTKG